MLGLLCNTTITAVDKDRTHILSVFKVETFNKNQPQCNI